MTLDELISLGNQASVSIAAGHDCMWTGDYLEPALWEDLRVEMQRRYRRSTGETMAVLTVDNNPTTDSIITTDAQEKFKLWFFRNLNDFQREALLSLFGLHVDELNTRGAQMIALRHILTELR